MAGRRKEYRTWDELSVAERRRGLTVLGGIGLLTVGAVVWLFGDTSATTPRGAPAPPTGAAVVEVAATRDAGPSLDEWYAAIDGHRREIGAAEVDVRRAIADANGVALQPACALLSTQASAADGVAVATPAGEPGEAWSEGLRAFKQATRWCAQLFDGTQIPPPTLLQETTTSLDAADTAWAKLAPLTDATADGDDATLAVPSAAAGAGVPASAGAAAS
ncbi:hypothetical protein I6A84_03335 [Frankia sp. CNm7]|uniref:Uncharacterized protein n=1 Tax=Frankia nepalensis TaxID=1836974 RepID=A0A937UTY1_9ACTN|nr:hypothetical protein [Frankia nepalensis]MBL7498612.1 hypothetical protein [Frankia nepalensis]MBL7510482.1 hypothetical protein [Frankia nepalensis]MBL7517179.1 hypothetical protein [Frankia nepalensis]MBL7630511.1 hypothetical protein [Frankia nepalensis]